MVKCLRGKESLILTGLGVVGVIGTGVSAALATPKALANLEAFEDVEYNSQMRKYEDNGGFFKVSGSGCSVEPTDFEFELPTWRKALVIAPYYIPTMLIATATATCIISSYVKSVKTQQSLIAAYTVLDSAYKSYKDKNIELYGEEADRQIVKVMAYGQFEDIVVMDGEELFYDEYSGRYFKSTSEVVKTAEYELNRNFTTRGYCELNEFYELLGIEPTDYGHVIGWNLALGDCWYGYSWIDFKHQVEESENGFEYTIISYPFIPTADFLY